MQKRWLARIIGGLIGGGLLAVLYGLANDGLASLSLLQKSLPPLFGLVVGGLLADAWFERRYPSRPVEASSEVEEAEPSQQGDNFL